LNAALKMTGHYCLYTVLHTLPKGKPVCGVTSLGDEVFVLRPKGGRDQVEVYDVITYRLLRCITVPNLRGYADMTSCEHYHCVYIADHVAMCIHRVDALRGRVDVNNVTQWPVNDKPHGISVPMYTYWSDVLVTCRGVRKIKEFNTHGVLLRQMTLPDDVIKPWHAIRLTNGQYVVCHGSRVGGDAVHRVCLLSDDVTQIVHSHGGQPGSHTGQYRVPVHLAVDNDGYVFVSDVINRRVTLLSPTLDYVRQVVSRDKLKWRSGCLHLDVQRRRLYVAVSKWKDNMYTAGRVVVLSSADFLTLGN